MISAGGGGGRGDDTVAIVKRRPRLSPDETRSFIWRVGHHRVNRISVEIETANLEESGAFGFLGIESSPINRESLLISRHIFARFRLTNGEEGRIYIEGKEREIVIL